MLTLRQTFGWKYTVLNEPKVIKRIHNKKQHKPLTKKKNPVCFYSVRCTNKLIWLSKLYLKSYIQLLLHNHIIHYQKFMKTYLQINESKITLKAFKSHSLSHFIHTFEQRPCKLHNTEGIPRGLCNKERTKQFRYGCGTDSGSHAQSQHTLLFMWGGF